MGNRDAEFLDHFGSHDRDDVFGRGAIAAIPLQGALSWTLSVSNVSRLMAVLTEAIHRGCGVVLTTSKLWGCSICG